VALLWLRLKAPFAAFRWMQAGVWRGTSPVIPPSAAWGLVLNLAGIETRSDESGETTLIRADAPVLELAIADADGATREHSHERASLYQQLHTYPVGKSGKEFQARTYGNKYWIAPVRRELLVGFDMVLGVRGPGGLLERVTRGLRGELGERRYGLPFAGDNNLLFDRIDVLPSPPSARWYTPVRRDDGVRAQSCRLTIAIDRDDASRTTSALFAPIAEPAEAPPPAAWVFVPRAA
jgi:CRISPR-associated protein Cas5t